MRLAAQHQRRAIKFGVCSRELRLKSADASRPDPSTDQMKDGRDGREQHQRKDGEARDIRFNRPHVERKARRRLRGLRSVLGARERPRKEAKEKGRRSFGPVRAAELSRPSADPEAPRPVEPPQRIASLRARRRRLRPPSCPPTVSLRHEGPNQLSLGLRKVCRKVVNHNGPAQSTATQRDSIGRRRQVPQRQHMPMSGDSSRANLFASLRRFPAIGQGRGRL